MGSWLSRRAALVLACALLVALGGATGTIAGALVTSKDIKNGTIKVVDLNAKTVKRLQKEPTGRTGSITLAGGAFSARDEPITWVPGTGCFRPGIPTAGMRHTIPVMAGATVTALDVRSYNSSEYAQQFTLTVFAQRPGSSSSPTVRSQVVDQAPGSGLTETRIVLDPAEKADAGEALYVSFSATGTSSWLCAVEVELSY